MADYSYIGSGKIYMRVKGAAAALVEVGNCSALQFAINENVITLVDYTKPGGGTYNEVRRIESVELSLTAHDLSPDNLQRALFGYTSATTAGSVSSEAGVGYVDGITPTARPLDVNGTTGVTGTGGTPTYTEGTDWEARPGGIYVLSGGAITDGTALEISYDALGFDTVQALTASAQEYEMVFDGLNEARSGKSVVIQAFRVKLGAAANIALIGDEFAALELTGKVLQDSSKTGANVSQYFTAKMVQ
jgi:hypothetical protein